jgi:sec-independent protein translocase protein TatA
MPNIGPLEIIILLVIVLVIFGPKRLPELGKGLGKGMREFKDSITGKDDEPKELGASNTTQTTGQATAPPEQAAPAAQQEPAAPATAPSAPPPAAAEPSEPETAQTGEPR